MLKKLAGLVDHTELKRGLKDLALEKVVDRVDQFDAALGVFEKVGFKLARLDVEIGISPGVQAHFAITKTPTEEEQKEALAELISEASLHSLLSSMLKACKLHRMLRVGTLDLNGLVVTLSTMPSVQLVFSDDPSGPIEEA